MAAYPHLRTSLMFVRVRSRVAQQIPLGVHPGAAGALACAGVQVQVLALGVARTCRDPPRAQPWLHPLRHGSVLPLGVESHLQIEVMQAFNPPNLGNQFGPHIEPQVHINRATGLTT